jgi:AcrR family transcriptional regulator
MNSSTQSRATRADARRNRDRLLDAATRVFGERGANAPLDEIARRAGVGSGTLYRHFSSRDALLAALAHHAFTKLEREAAALRGADRPRDALITWLRSLIEYTATTRGLASALVACQDDASSALQPPCALIADTMATLLDRAQAAGLVRRDLRDDDLGRLAYGIALVAEANRGDEGLADRLVQLAVDGIGPTHLATADSG